MRDVVRRSWETALLVAPCWWRKLMVNTPHVPEVKGRDYVLDYRRNRAFI
jgi:hypothetical protein